ncbi:MAG: sigma-70 family RNA polymerase sigma factor [Armatimonadetes bacterium]|nr:sigma-70 family RNA polymerase sigma factor [Armatimonadota bacterium]
MAHLMQFEEHDDGVPSYLNRLTQAPLLSASEELELARAARAGDRNARQRLIESNMRLVINIAKTYKVRSISLEDLIQEGAIGLMQAADRYDPEKGFRFSTYATHWIRQAIGRAINNKAKAIRLPAHVSQSLRRIEKERVRLMRELGREPSTEQLSQALGCTTKKLLAILQCSQELLSLDMGTSDGSGATLGSLISDPDYVDPEQQVCYRELIGELLKLLSELSDRERDIILRRYHLVEGSENLQQEDVAREFQLSRERIRQIENQAMKKLRTIAQRRRLREMLNG